MTDTDLYKDLLADSKNQRHFFMVLVVVLVVLLALSIAGIFALSMHNQKLLKDMSTSCNQKIMDFISETDFYVDYEITTTDAGQNSGGISVTK